MEKVLNFLEKHVEWVAVAIGTIFLFAMVFIYLMGTPVAAKLADRTVTPANVETVVRDEAGSRLEAAMQHNNVPSAAIQSYAEEFRKHMANAEDNAPVVSGKVWVTAAGVPPQPLARIDTPEAGTKQQQVAGVPQSLPAPKWYGVSTGKSTVQTDPAASPSTPEYGGEPSGGYGEVPPEMRSYSPSAVANPASAKDKIWATVAYTVDVKALTASFAQAKIPNNRTTVFLRLDVMREERLPNGSWGKGVAIEPLAYHQVPSFPRGSGVEERTYADWASKNAAALVAPPFYPRAAGDIWFAPGQPNPNQVKEVRPVSDPAAAPAVRPRRTRGFRGDDPYMPTPEIPDYGVPKEPSVDLSSRPQVMVPDGYAVPTGNFNPSELTSDIFVWFHDDTVEPGKTYRYQMSYRLRNPLHGLARLAESAEAAKLFAIASPPSGWTEPVTIGEVSRFFVASGVSGSSTSVRFDVFRWQGGQWNMKQYTVSPGDMIGSKDGDIDYQTGWTLADINAASLTREPVILADDNGRLRTRSFQSDNGLADQFKKSINWKDPNAPVRTTPTPTADGMPMP